MRSIAHAAAALAVLAAASPALAQSQPGDGSLMINPDARQWAFRAAGVPWICMADGRCVQIRVDGMAPGLIVGAEIAGLGFAGDAYYLALRHADVAGGRQQAFRCTAEACARSDLPPGEFAFLGTHSLMLQVRLQSRAAILARPADAPDRSRLMWCTDRACTEQAFTRDNRYDLTFMGTAPMDGRNRVFLRERGGTVFACAPTEAAGEDRFDCTPTALVFPDVAASAGEPSEPDQNSLVAAVEDAIRRGNWAEADRLIAEGRARFPAQPQWAQFERRLTQLRAERDSRARIDRARRLVNDARRYATAGDFRAAEAVLQEAAALAPGLAEIAQARADVSRMRTERYQRYRERNQFVAAIDQALVAFRLWEAEGLIAEALRRFPNDPEFRNLERRASQLRAQAEWQGRLRRAERHVAEAREAMRRQQFGEAERELDAAEALAMGLPEIRAARGELARLRIEADQRTADIRQITIDIEALLGRNDIARAERMLEFATRRHPAHPGWADLRRRIDRAKSTTPPPGPGAPQIARLIAQADAAVAKKDWAEANRLILEAEALDRAAPAVVAARKSLDARRLEAQRSAQKFIADGEAAVKAKDWPKAEKAAADAEAADPLNPAVQAAVRKLKSDIAAGKGAGPVPGATAPLLAAADAAIAKKDWAAANRELAKAAAIDATSPAVMAARKRLEDARLDARNKAEPVAKAAQAAINRGERANADKLVAQVKEIDPFGPAVRMLAAEYKKKGW